MRKWLKRVKDAVRPYGYRLRRKRTSSNHLLLRNDETGHQIVCSFSPTNEDHALKNVVRDIERYG